MGPGLFIPTPNHLTTPMTDPKDLADALAQDLTPSPILPQDCLRTGSTLLDLAISGSTHGGFSKGRYFWMVGDSSSGKTFLTLTCLAEAAANPAFDDYQLIYDNAEDGALMDMPRYFGQRMADRLRPPGGTVASPVYSQTVEQFYYHLDDAAKSGKPYIYLLDSMDALTTKYADTKFDQAKTAARKGTKAAGDYGDGKAKTNSTRLRSVVHQLRDSGSILLVLSQTRDNINAGLFEEQQTYAGGRALRFYATVQLWSKAGAKLKRTVRGRDVQVGVTCRVAVKKNRITGRDRTVEFPIYYDTGIDDTGSLVDWLVAWRYWTKNKQGRIDATTDYDDAPDTREALVAWLDQDADLRADLVDLVRARWAEVEQAAAITRRPRYE